MRFQIVAIKVMHMVFLKKLNFPFALVLNREVFVPHDIWDNKVFLMV